MLGVIDNVRGPLRGCNVWSKAAGSGERDAVSVLLRDSAGGYVHFCRQSGAGHGRMYAGPAPLITQHQQPMFAAIRRASSFVSSLAAECRRAGKSECQALILMTDKFAPSESHNKLEIMSAPTQVGASGDGGR
jgi:hypothetical protein